MTGPVVTAYTTADVGRHLTTHQLRTCATSLGAPADVDDVVQWLRDRSPGVTIARTDDGVTIHRAPVTTYRQGHGWVA